MTVSVAFQYINRPRHFLGAPFGDHRNQYGHYILKLPTRLLVDHPTVDIVGLWLQCDGFLGTAGAAFLVFHDKGMAATNEALNPLTQNFDCMFLQPLGQMTVTQSPSGIILSQYFQFNHPIRYTPTEDALMVIIDGGPSANPVGHVVIPVIAMDEPPAWMSNKPDDIPHPDCTTGNDKHTRLLIHCDGPDGSPNFFDSSWRNYTMRFFGGVRVKNYSGVGWATFSDGILAAEINAPGYGSDSDVTHCDWNPGADPFTFDVRVVPGLAAPAHGAIVAFDHGLCPFRIVQEGAFYKFYASKSVGGSTPTSWDVANSVPMGPAVFNTETHLAVVRSGTSIYLFNNGALINTVTGVTAPLFYPTNSGLPRGQIMFGGCCNISTTGTVVVDYGMAFTGRMREMRWSKTARWTTAFTPPAGDYGP